MRFFRSTRTLLWFFTLLFPVAGWALRQGESADSVADLAKKIEDQKIVLNYDEEHGYLRSLLNELKVPVSSQTLVFSKSSFQLSQISPATPRAIYFNDDTYVGWVNFGQFIEVASINPKDGPDFYTLTQEKDP